MLRFYVLRLTAWFVLLLAVVSCVYSGRVEAQETSAAEVKPDGSLVITLTPAQAANCVRKGGCSVVTLEYEHALALEAYETGRKECGPAPLKKDEKEI